MTSIESSGAVSMPPIIGAAIRLITSDPMLLTLLTLMLGACCAAAASCLPDLNGRVDSNLRFGRLR